MARRDDFIPCPVCREPVSIIGLAPTDLAEVTCISRYCIAMHTWTPERWAGAARTAAARRDTGIVLTAVDLEALARADRILEAAAL
jgi:hypothetical protein